MRGFSHTVRWQFSHVFVLRVRNRAETLFELQQKSKFRPRGRLCIIGDQTAMTRKTTPERLSFFQRDIRRPDHGAAALPFPARGRCLNQFESPTSRA